jgi:hypothetical protein
VCHKKSFLPADGKFHQAISRYLKTRANLGTKRKSRNTNSIRIFVLFSPSTNVRKFTVARIGLRFLVRLQGRARHSVRAGSPKP